MKGNTRLLIVRGVLGLAALAATSCSKSGPEGDTPKANQGVSASKTDASEVAATGMPTHLWSDTPLEGAVNVLDVRGSGVDGARVVVRGTLQDFGEYATFRLVEDSLLDCTEMGEKDHCKTPWDYCCEDPAKLRSLTVNVEFLDGEFPAQWSLEGQHGLGRLTEVAVAGVLRVDDQGNLRIEANKLSLQ